MFLPKVRDVMVKDFTILDISAPLRDAFQVVVKDDVNSVIITREGRPAGILTRRDLIRCFLQRVDCEQMTVGDFMSYPLITIDSDENVLKAYEVMMRNDIRRLAVLERGEIVGGITLGDIRHLASQTPGTVFVRVGYFLMGVLVTAAVVVIILTL